MKKLPLSEVKKRLKQHGFELVGPYESYKIPIKVRCVKNGHPGERMFGTITLGDAGCVACDRNHFTHDEIISIVKAKGGRIIGRLPNILFGRTLGNFQCAVGHKWTFELQRLRGGRWCPECSSQRYTDHELVAHIVSLADRLGRNPEILDFTGSGIDYSTILKRLGGRERAFALANLSIPKAPTKKEAIEAIQSAATTLGDVPSRQWYDSLSPSTSGSQIAKLFGGSWSKAIKSAGFIPRAGMGGRIWKVWETTCVKAAVELYGADHVHRQFRYGPKHLRTIDIFVKDMRLGIDAKLSAYMHEETSKIQIDDFVHSGKFKRIEFWCLSDGVHRDDRIHFVLVDEILERLRKKGTKAALKIASLMQAIQKKTPAVRKMSGLPTKASLIKELQSFQKKEGRFPQSTELVSNRLHGAGTYREVFGSFSKALVAAGDNPPKSYWMGLTDKQLIRVFKKFMKEKCGGRIPTCTELHGLVGFPNLGVYTNRAGTYSKWLKMCGLSSKKSEYYARLKSLSKEEAIDILKRAYKKSGAPLVGKDDAFHAFVVWAPSCQWYRRTFGSWHKALDLANIPILRDRSIRHTRESALKALRKAYKLSGGELIGKGSLYRQFVKDAPTVDWYRREFGSWANALKEAGVGNH